MTPVRVAAAVIQDRTGRILIARRPDHLHQGGYWEFPGGKLEPGEDPQTALGRELTEELGIQPLDSRPLARIRHRYPDKTVELYFHHVTAWRGEAHGKEGQAIAWVLPADLDPARFPAANRPIVNRLRLPRRYLITPDPGTDWDDFLTHLDNLLTRGIALLQLRAPRLPEARYRTLAREVVSLAHRHHARVLLNTTPRLALTLEADGVHLTSARLLALKQRPLPPELLVGASIHDTAQLAHAEALRADLVCLSPVRPTTSHPRAIPLGWPRFARLTATTALPVYALGGLGEDQLPEALTHGAQGIAAIRGLWGNWR